MRWRYGWVVVLLGAAACHALPRARTHETPESAPLSLPREDDRLVEVHPYIGIPVLQKSLFWDGNGEVDDGGIKFRHHWFLSDRITLGLGLTAVVYATSGHEVFALEGEPIGRWYFWRDEGFAAFWEMTAGYQQSTDPIPPGGTEWNFSFSFGPGVLVPVEKDVDLLGGVTYHHISNALGRESPHNPSQNEVQLWLGIGWRF